MQKRVFFSMSLCLFPVGAALLLCPLHARAQSPAPAATIHIELAQGVAFDMVRIEPGTFTIGSPATEPNRKIIEKQQRIIITKPFYMGSCEVTQALWEYVMTAKITNPRARVNGCGLYWKPGDTMDINCNARPSKWTDPQKPVDSVSWRQCKEFIARLNLLVEGPPFGLPTEAQWEYAARAGSTTSWFFGNDESNLAAYAWYKINSDQQTHRVGTTRLNALGLYDMYGNVWEWCEDMFDENPYPSRAEALVDYSHRGGEGGTKYQIIRGGSFLFSAAMCRSAHRSGFDPWQHDFDIGLRLVRQAP